MRVHQLHLHPEPFAHIRSGQKTVESRLFDEKRRNYSVGDKLVFINRTNEREIIEAIITHLYNARSFRDLFLEVSTKENFSTDTLQELLDGIAQYYTKDDQEKYGVVGIGFIINDIK